VFNTHFVSATLFAASVTSRWAAYQHAIIAHSSAGVDGQRQTLDAVN